MKTRNDVLNIFCKDITKVIIVENIKEEACSVKKIDEENYKGVCSLLYSFSRENKIKHITGTPNVHFESNAIISTEDGPVFRLLDCYDSNITNNGKELIVNNSKIQELLNFTQELHSDEYQYSAVSPNISLEVIVDKQGNINHKIYLALEPDKYALLVDTSNNIHNLKEYIIKMINIFRGQLVGAINFSFNLN